ncbi:MAG: hypothetical protein NTU63_02255 [Candidatus Pacearchaeota archaeon]|nr:hypothetical protein [Candidatus Pacearchaeota archaeon]
MRKKFWCEHSKKEKRMSYCACGGGAYFLGIIGAAVYYIQQSSTFWQGIVGVLKALVWPAFLVYKLLG